MECPICFEYINISCIPSCTHHFCYVCLIKWCNHKKEPKCPICKIDIREIKFDKEFDELNNKLINLQNINNNSQNIENNYFNNLIIYNNYITKFNINKKIYLHFNNNNSDVPIGITVKNNNGPGIKIIKIISNNLAQQSGLKKNDIILYINNIECNSHEICINILDSLKKCNKTACCILLEKIFN
jgi:hypothetical protein